MDRKIIKSLKIVAIILVIILLIELGYIFYVSFFTKERHVYFDGINALCYMDNSYVTVGSNNNNDQYMEKAKFTKYNSKKEKVFEKLYNKGYNGAFFGIVMDGDDYIVVGSYEATEEEHKDGVRSALIVKYDKDGNILFDKDFQVLGNSKFTNILVTEDGYILTGQSIYENMTLGFSKDGGAFLVKYDKDGKLIWKKNYGGSKSAIYNDLIIKGDYIYAVGKDATSVGVISKYDINGNHIITTNYKYTDSFGFTGIVEINDRLYVSTAKGATGNTNDTDAMIVVYDLDCNYISETVYKGKGRERYNRLINDVHNNLIAIGTTAVVNKKTSNDGVDEYKYDGIIGKYNSSLEEVAVINYGDDRDDYFTDVKLVDNNYLVTGYSSYEDGSYLSKFITYSDALKVLEVE